MTSIMQQQPPSLQPTSHRNKLTLAQGRYVCQKTLGCGTYGRVLQCLDQRTNTVVAVKVSQKESAYSRAALMEYSTILALQEHTPYTVRVSEQFEERGHICIVMEMLSSNLFELGRKRVENCGDLLPVEELRQIVFCVFSALAELHRLGMMHCDIKPENVMVRSGRATRRVSFLGSPASPAIYLPRHSCDASSSSSSFTSSPAAATHGDGIRRPSFNGNMNSPMWAMAATPTTPDVCSPLSLAACNAAQCPPNSSGVDWNNTCLIDYGAVRRLHENNYFDIQSMWYRAPEVLCYVPYTPKIDSWSMGCLLYEMYTGRPLFMGNEPVEQLQLITDIVGCFPHLRERYPKLAANKPDHRHDALTEVLRRRVEAAREKHLAKNAAKNGTPYQQSLEQHPPRQQRLEEALFVDLMAQLLCPNEYHRLSCEQALQHPFFTTGSLSPSPCGANPNGTPSLSSRIPFPQNVMSSGSSQHHFSRQMNNNNNNNLNNADSFSFRGGLSSQLAPSWCPSVGNSNTVNTNMATKSHPLLRTN